MLYRLQVTELFKETNDSRRWCMFCSEIKSRKDSRVRHETYYCVANPDRKAVPGKKATKISAKESGKESAKKFTKKSRKKKVEE